MSPHAAAQPLIACELDGDVYRELGTWRPGETARLTSPFPVEIVIEHLVPPSADALDAP